MLREEEKKSAITHMGDEEGYLRELSDADRAKLADVEERIKKLLNFNKDGRSVSTQEMQTAMDLAVKLARKNGLDLYRIEREMNKGQGAFVVRIMELGGHANWRVQLASTICRAVICRMVIHHETQHSKPNLRTGRTYRHPRANHVSVIGMPQDIELVDYLYEFIVRELQKRVEPLYKEDAAAARLVGERLSGKAYRDDFYRGAVQALDSRLREMFQPKPAADVDDDRADYDAEPDYDDERVQDDMALVPLKEADVEQALNEAFPNLKKGSADIWTKQRSGDSAELSVFIHNAYMAGHKTGKTMDLRHPLNERAATGALASGE